MLKEVVVNPAKAFSEIHESGRKYLPWSVLFVVMPKIVAALINTDVFYLKNAPVSIVEWIAATALLYFVSGVLGGRANFPGLLSAVGYAWFPLSSLPVLGTLALASIPEDVIAIIRNTPEDQISQEQAIYVISHVFTPVTVALTLVMVAVMLWSFALGVLAVRESNGFSTWKAFWIALSVVLIDIFVISAILKAVAGRIALISIQGWR